MFQCLLLMFIFRFQNINFIICSRNAPQWPILLIILISIYIKLFSESSEFILSWIPIFVNIEVQKVDSSLFRNLDEESKCCLSHLNLWSAIHWSDPVFFGRYGRLTNYVTYRLNNRHVCPVWPYTAKCLCSKRQCINLEIFIFSSKDIPYVLHNHCGKCIWLSLLQVSKQVVDMFESRMICWCHNWQS